VNKSINFFVNLLRCIFVKDKIIFQFIVKMLY